MPSLEDLFAKDPLMKSDLMEVRYLATQGKPEEAGERMMAIEGAIYRIVSDPDYKGDITPEDL